MIELRPYQSEARDAILTAWNEGVQKALLVLPTGCGKTIVFASVVDDKVKQGKRVLIVAHRGELLEQAADKLKNAYGIDSALEKAQNTALGSDELVTVGSVQSLAQATRLVKFPADYYDYIIVDEAHHVMSDTYQTVVRHFPDAKVLGVTATPDRGDQKNLAKYFEKKVYEYPMAKAIKEGYLVPIVAKQIPLDIDLTGVTLSKGDYAVGSVSTALDPYLAQIADELVEFCKDRKTVVFLPLINTSQKMCAMLNNRGFRAAEVNGDSSDRSEILKKFEQGDYNILCNSMLLTEGWDCPSVDCIVVLRPTKVRSLYRQMVGRGMRLSPETGKKDLLLLDFLWLTGKHDLCRPSAMVADDEELAKAIDKKVGEEGTDILKAREEAIREREEAVKKRLEAEAKKRKNSDRKIRTIDPLQFAFDIDDHELINYVPVFQWEMAEPTEKQLTTLKGLGIDTDAITTKGMASVYIDKAMKRRSSGLATPGQVKKLNEYGFQNVERWTISDASSMIGRIADPRDGGKWRLPLGVNPRTYKPKSEKEFEDKWMATF